MIAASIVGFGQIYARNTPSPLRKIKPRPGRPGRRIKDPIEGTVGPC